MRECVCCFSNYCVQELCPFIVQTVSHDSCHTSRICVFKTCVASSSQQAICARVRAWDSVLKAVEVLGTVSAKRTGVKRNSRTRAPC